MKQRMTTVLLVLILTVISISGGGDAIAENELLPVNRGGRVESNTPLWEEEYLQANGGIALLAATYTVYVGGMEMNVADDGEPAYLKNGGTAGREEDFNAKLWYDTEDAVLKLELNNLTASGDSAYASSNVKRCAGIYSTVPMQLILNGENSVTGVQYGSKSSSAIYGIRANGMLITGTGSLHVSTAEATNVKTVYGIYSGSGGSLMIESGTIQIDTENAAATYSGGVNYGIYAYSFGFGSANTSPVLEVKAGTGRMESCAVHGYAGISIFSGDVTANAGRATSGYADGLLSNKSTIYIRGGRVVSSSEGAYGGMSTGICANVLEVTGGEVRATGGLTVNGKQQSAGIYTNYDITISGGTVYGIGQEAYGDVSFGINSWRGDITISNDAVVYATGGPASYSVGLSAERRYESSMTPVRAGGDITIQDSAKVYASVDSVQGETRVYSYGMFVGGNLLIEGSPYVETAGGKISEDWITGLTFDPPREKRSFGIYLANEIYDGTDTNYKDGGHSADETAERHTIHITGGTVIAKADEEANGWMTYTDEDGNLFNVYHRSYAVVLYDADRIDFANDVQPDATWYQWKIDADNAFTLSTEDEYPDAEKWQSATRYFHVEPMSEYKPVTFKVVNGTWEGMNPADITLQVELKDGTGSLAEHIPTGMQPAAGYEGGAWDVVPPASVSGSAPATYTYTFTAKVAITKPVRFVVVNGSWSDGTTDDKTLNIPLTYTSANTAETAAGTLAVIDVPAGMLASAGFEGGAWDDDLSQDITLTGTNEVVYTYTFTAKDAITKPVRFVVVNGSWSDGTTADKTLNIPLTYTSANTAETAVGTLQQSEIPAGMIPATGCTNGSWDVQPLSGTVTGTEPLVYTYAFKAYKPVTFQVVNGTWTDGSTTDITVQIPLVDDRGLPAVNGCGTLTSFIPSGMQPDSGYYGGAWDEAPPATVSGMAAETYVYRFAELPPVYKEVVFRIIHGVWADQTSADIVCYIPLTDANGIPAANGTGMVDAPAGMIPNKGYENGAWDVEPAAVVSGTDRVVYTYSFEAKLPVYKPVVFRVVNGTWADGSTEDILIQVPLTDTKGYPDAKGTGKLDIPTGMKPFDGYDPSGYWDITPTEAVSGTESLTYTFIFAEKPPEIVLPETGDNTRIDLHICIGLMATAMLAAFSLRRRRANKRPNSSELMGNP